MSEISSNKPAVRGGTSWAPNGAAAAEGGWLGGVASRATKYVRGMLGREIAKHAIGSMLGWPRGGTLVPGYSVILGVPWHLRHLLEVNLRFLAKLDRRCLRQIHVVLDRVAPDELKRMERSVRTNHPGLPVAFQCYSGLSGRLVERLDISTFYNSMNCATALSAIDSSHAILHDFDLYPLRADHFERMYEQMVRHRLHYCGVELTSFDGLTADDFVLGTWGLGMDVGWLRETHRPIEIFHSVRRVGDRLISLDPFSESQLRPHVRRELVQDVVPDDFCHVKNLCSSFLRFSTGRPVNIAWRLHYLWYLESLIGRRDLRSVVDRMDRSDGTSIEVDGRVVEFAGTHPTCANVLRTELSRMDRFLHGEVRLEVVRYVESFRDFLEAVAMGRRTARPIEDQKAA